MQNTRLNLYYKTIYQSQAIKKGEIIMPNTHIKENIVNQIDRLPYDLQLRVLDFAASLSPKGVEGKALLRFKGTISANDLRQISKAIDEDCEKADISEW